MRNEFFVCTTIDRLDIDAVLAGFDVVVYFTAKGTGRHPQVTWVEYTEIETTFLRAEFDGGVPDDAPYPLTAAEIAHLQAWLESPDGYAAACEAVERDPPDDDPDPDYAHDKWRDDQMARAV
jgi:hypothetical protein